ncbi:hypothetical protein, partial [Streptomyces erythrochromogenes]|uniref:hypothetical protein n=1 Tax=Streptomyces erythrochromogenes TaxID=285574 RepID=UPI003689872C
MTLLSDQADAVRALVESADPGAVWGGGGRRVAARGGLRILVGGRHLVVRHVLLGADAGSARALVGA